MDIDRWLEDTAAPGSLPPTAPPPTLKQSLHTSHEHRKHNRKRKAPSPASSILEPAALHNAVNAGSAPAAVHKTRIARSATDPATSASSAKAPSLPAPDIYERRPRRKTRPDLYDPKPDKSKKEKQHKNQHAEGSPNRRHRKKKRRNHEKAGLNVADNFEAKNVPTERLTLKHKSEIGLFQKGRASNPIRGKGLPDLTFSEMKFLQKRASSENEPIAAEQQKKSRKRERDPVSNEEFSAYFGSKRPALAERSINVPSKLDKAKRTTSHRSIVGRQRQPSSNAESMLQTVELPEKPFLGFGSKGPRPSSASYFTWSESVKAPSQLRNSVRMSSVARATGLQQREVDRQRPPSRGKVPNDQDVNVPPSDDTADLQRTLREQAAKHLSSRFPQPTRDTRQSSSSSIKFQRKTLRTQVVKEQTSGAPAFQPNVASESHSSHGQSNPVDAFPFQRINVRDYGISRDALRQSMAQPERQPNLGSTVRSQKRHGHPIEYDMQTSHVAEEDYRQRQICHTRVIGEATPTVIRVLPTRGRSSGFSEPLLRLHLAWFREDQPTYMGQPLNDTQFEDQADGTSVTPDITDHIYRFNEDGEDGVEYSENEDADIADMIYGNPLRLAGGEGEPPSEEQLQWPEQDSGEGGVDDDQAVFEGFWQPNVLY